MFKKRLKEARRYQKLTQQELANIVGVAKSTIGGYEAGYRNPDPQTLRKLASALDTTVDYLVGHDFRWVDNLPPDLQKFVLDPDNRVVLRVAESIKRSGVAPETVHAIIKTLAEDAKKRTEEINKEVQNTGTNNNNI